MDFSNKTDVLIEHNGIEYNCDLKFNGNLLNLTMCSSKGDLIVAFTVDSLTCTIAYGELKKSYETDKIYEDFLPIKLFRFFNANGTVLKFKSDDKAGTAVFDSIIGEPHIYIASDNTIIFQIN